MTDEHDHLSFWRGCLLSVGLGLLLLIVAVGSIACAVAGCRG